MKGNNGKGNNSLRDEWRTPDDFFNELNKEYGFRFDCCATSQNKKCSEFSSNFLDIKYMEVNAWMNPPFSKAWMMFEHFFGIVKHGVAIYRCDNLETGIWQKIILPACDWIFIPNKRVSYEGLDGEGARFPSALIGIGVLPPKGIPGIIMEVKK